MKCVCKSEFDKAMDRLVEVADEATHGVYGCALANAILDVARLAHEANQERQDQSGSREGEVLEPIRIPDVGGMEASLRRTTASGAEAMSTDDEMQQLRDANQFLNGKLSECMRHLHPLKGSAADSPSVTASVALEEAMVELDGARNGLHRCYLTMDEADALWKHIAQQTATLDALRGANRP